MTEYATWYQSPIGTIEIRGNEHGILNVEFREEAGIEHDNLPDTIINCVLQLNEYFSGARRKFDLNLIPEGTEFQKKVWEALTTIPYCKTASYGEIAKKIGNPDASRAVGMANNKNKISIIIPCHRVIGATGKLVGYAGGLWRKEWLLNFEKRNQNDKLF